MGHFNFLTYARKLMCRKIIAELFLHITKFRFQKWKHVTTPGFPITYHRGTA